MIGYWGSLYTFDNNAIVIGERCHVNFNKGGQMMSVHREFDVRGYLSGADQTAITTAMNALKTALAKPYQDFTFKNDDTTNSSSVLLNSTSISGVTISDGPDFVLSNKGNEYGTQREFSFTVQADYPLDNTQNLLLEFSESMEFWGGGPKFAIMDAVEGKAQKHQYKTSTGFFCIQRGTIVGYRKEPPLPPCRWPNDLLEAPNISPVSPEKFGKGYQGYRLSYSYRCGAVNPLIGKPTLWV